MPRPLRAYTTHAGGRLSDSARATLGIPMTVRQARVIVVATSLRAARALMDGQQCGHPADLRPAQGHPLADSIRDHAAGVPGVYVTAITAQVGHVVAVVRDGLATRVGTVASSPSGSGFVFAPAPV